MFAVDAPKGGNGKFDATIFEGVKEPDAWDWMQKVWPSYPNQTQKNKIPGFYAATYLHAVPATRPGEVTPPPVPVDKPAWPVKFAQAFGVISAGGYDHTRYSKAELQALLNEYLAAIADNKYSNSGRPDTQFQLVIQNEINYTPPPPVVVDTIGTKYPAAKPAYDAAKTALKDLYTTVQGLPDRDAILAQIEEDFEKVFAGG